MSKYELTIDTNYVSRWGVVEAVRELFQNSVDEEIQNPSNVRLWKYDETAQKLYIGNKESVLDVETLLLGVTSKSNNDNTIGQFGEGYKIATVVLLRTNHPITFYNYGNKEVWTTKLVKSRRFGGRLVPTFNIDKNYPWQKVPDNNLTIVIENITPEEYVQIQTYILPLQKDIGVTYNCHEYGTILIEDRYKGMVFVGGLFVCKNDRLRYGYNISPKYLKLDRDRCAVDEFNLLWNTSRMWGECSDKEQLADILFEQDVADVTYLGTLRDFLSRDKTILAAFIAKYGENAIPVTSQEDYDKVLMLGGHPVFVGKAVAEMFHSRYDDFVSTAREQKPCKDVLEEWFNRLCGDVDVPADYITEFYTILETYEDILE